MMGVEAATRVSSRLTTRKRTTELTSDTSSKEDGQDVIRPPAPLLKQQPAKAIRKVPHVLLGRSRLLHALRIRNALLPAQHGPEVRRRVLVLGVVRGPLPEVQLLRAHEARVDAVLVLEERLVVPELDDLALLQDDDLVGFLDGGEAVGDGDGGAVLGDAVEGCLDDFLAANLCFVRSILERRSVFREVPHR